MDHHHDDDAQLAERMLHARIEVLLREVIQHGIGRLTSRDHQPVVALTADGEHAVRWLRAGTDAELLGAIAGELEAVAVACLLVEERRGGNVVGNAVTVSRGGARVLPFEITRRRFGRARVAAGVESEPRGTALQVAAALQRSILRVAHRTEGAVGRAVDPPIA